MTGLAGRGRWTEIAERDIASGQSGNVLLCDIDHLEQINVTYGHATGDLVLAEVARILERHGLAGRLGGDEFGLWLPDDFAGPATAEQIVAEVTRVFAQRAGQAVSVSIGVSRSGRDLTAALDRARALRAAKTAGRNRACCHDPAA